MVSTHIPTADDKARALERAHAQIRTNNRNGYQEILKANRIATTVPWGITAIAVLVALVSTLLTVKYAGTITTVQQIASLNAQGQVVGINDRIIRIDGGIGAKAAITTFLKDVFETTISPLATKQDVSDAESMIGTQPVKYAVEQWWATHSPLRPDGSFIMPNHETHVVVSSIVERSRAGNDIEYSVNYSRVIMKSPSTTTNYIADIILHPTHTANNGSLIGYIVTHLSFNQEQ